MGFSQHFPRWETFSQTRIQVGQVIPVFTTQVEIDCYIYNFPGLPCFKKITADKHMLAELLLVNFVTIRFDAFDCWRLHESEIQVQGNQRFFFLAALRLVFAALQISHGEKNQEKPLGPGYAFSE